ncbi:MAG: hypothetical protein KGM43_14865 [Planctomycetota bacterium]|nr:hypothetical protein [Planctomycetota bacterium]
MIPSSLLHGGGILFELVRMLPDGAGVAGVLVVVILFLKQQDKSNRLIESLTTVFNEQIAFHHARWHDQFREINDRVSNNQRQYQDQIQTLVGAHLDVSRETITAIKSLELTLKTTPEHDHGD